jgi:DNA-binding XRE family transcriptional regulator
MEAACGSGVRPNHRAGALLRIEESQSKRRDERREFLLSLRRRVDPASTTLGSYERLKSRRGHPVTQEELAEGIGVSRGWYARLESGKPVKPSISMLHRIADALNATPRERALLFRLAIPALQVVTLCSLCGQLAS